MDERIDEQSRFKMWIQYSNRNIEKNSSWNEYRMENIDNPKLNSAENLRGREGSIDTWRQKQSIWTAHGMNL